MLSITILTDNAAFADDWGEEVARILRGLAGELTRYGSIGAKGRKGELRDVNGNLVGDWEATGN